MTYPPGSPGYPPAQSPGSYGASSTPSFAKSDDSGSNLKLLLTVGVLVLGLASYLLNYGLTIKHVLPNGEEQLEIGTNLSIDLALLAGLLAGVSLLPKARNYAAVVAAVSVLGALRLIEDTVGASGQGWQLWLALASGVVQAGLAVTVLLLDAGVITPPAPRPKYDQYGHYGQYGGYYGHQGQQGSYQPPQQSGYGAQYGGYPSGPSTGGFSSVGPQSGPQHGAPQAQHQGSPTPPTGFPSFSPPPSSGSGPGQANSANHGGVGQGQQSYGEGQHPQTPQAPSSPSGPSQS